MLVKDLIKLLKAQDPNADVVLFRDIIPAFEENDPEVQEIQLTIDDIVLGNTYVGIQIPSEGYTSVPEDDE